MYQGPVERVEPENHASNSPRRLSFSNFFSGEFKPSWLSLQLGQVACRTGCALIVAGLIAGCYGCYELLRLASPR